MIRIVFPTDQKLSYISKVVPKFDKAEYLTILNVRGQNITDVETIENPYLSSKNRFIETCKEKNLDIFIAINGSCLPLKKLEKNGISVFKTNEQKNVLHTFNDFVQDKLEKIQQ